MPPWQWTVAVNSIKAMAPFQGELHRLKRVLAPSRMEEKYDTQVVPGALEQIAAIEAHGVRVKGARVLEIGAGWYPVAALVYRAAGARSVALTDAHRLLHPRTLAAATAFVHDRADRLSARSASSVSGDPPGIGGIGRSRRGGERRCRRAHATPGLR